MSEFIGEIVRDAESVFPPRPGGLIDSTRQQRAAGQLSQTADSPAAEVPYSAVRVRPETPDLGTARTVTLSAANPVLTLLTRDPQRRSAVILSVDNDVYITSDHGLALQAAGGATAEGCFYLPAGIGIPVDTQAQLWVAATTTAASSRVSVLISRDSNA